MHTGWKSRGGGTWCFLPKSLGGSRLSGKVAWGGPSILGFIAFLLTSILKFVRGGYYIYPPTSPPPCVHLCNMKLDFISQPSSKTTLPFAGLQHMQQCQVKFHSIFASMLWSKWMLHENGFEPTTSQSWVFCLYP